MFHLKSSYFWILLIVISSTSINLQGQQKSKPNILFIFADDQNFNTINALGGYEVITPNLDQLSTNGVSFSNSFNMGGWGGAVCIASRTMLLTGKYIWNAKKANQLMAKNSYKTPVWSELMDGYDTYMTGKWHIKKPAEEVFKNTTHVRPGMPNQTATGYNRPLHKNDTLWKPWDTSKEGFWKGEKHWSEVLADDATNFIHEASKKDTPFFMYLAFNAPHDPRQSPKEYVDMYSLENISIPENFLTEYPYNEAMGAGRKLRDEQLAPFPRNEYAVKVNRQEYYASITHMDAQIGKIIKALEESGKLESTYIIFAADHGLAVGQHGLMGKQSMYDHSIRAPLIILGPEIPKNKKVNADVYIQDIMPTVLELANVKKPEFVEFHSFLDLAKLRQSESNYTSIYGCYMKTQRMIRSNGYKLIVYPTAKKMRLFNLENDPNEMYDLAEKPEYQSLKLKLFQELLTLQEDMNDPLNLENYFLN